MGTFPKTPKQTLQTQQAPTLADIGRPHEVRELVEQAKARGWIHPPAELREVNPPRGKKDKRDE